MFNIEANSLLKLPVRSLKKKTQQELGSLNEIDYYEIKSLSLLFQEDFPKITQ